MAIPFPLPKGQTTVKVAFICSAVLTGIPMSRFAKPSIRGLDMFDKVPSFSFFIEHPSGKRILFDLGVRRDWENLSPVLVQRIREAGWTADAAMDVPGILEENGISLQSISTVIWSHWHWDHIGDMSKFPNSTTLLTGPGFAEAFMPGYPKDQHSSILESDYAGRNHFEVRDFESKIGGLPAYDLFGDGSLYLLSTPGHAIGHLSALARSTSNNNKQDDTFILMGGDCCHHMGQLRPSIQYPLPYDTPFATASDGSSSNQKDIAWTSTCHNRGTSVPFMSISDYPNGASAALNPSDAVTTLQKLRGFDFDDDRVLFAIAHDKSLLDVVDLFPSFANDWKEKGWAKRARWLFLEEIRDIPNRT